MGIPTLKIRDENGNVVSVPAIKGDKGDSYVLTEEDKQEIANMSTTDQTYDPTSTNAQSGKAVAQAVANAGSGDSYTKAEIDAKIGDIETALEEIIEIQNSLIGGNA